MIYACDKNGEGLYRPGEIDKGFCGLCKGELVAKMGKIKVHHWAHGIVRDCDSWSEESDWHLDIKSLFKPEECEKILENHRADVFTRDVILEVQRSAISLEEVKTRNQFYSKYAERVKWLYYIDSPKIRIAYVPRSSILAENGTTLIVWKNPLKRIFEAEYLYIFCNGSYFRVDYYESDLYSNQFETAGGFSGNYTSDVFMIWVTEVKKDEIADHVRNRHVKMTKGQNTGMYKHFIKKWGDKW